MKYDCIATDPPWPVKTGRGTKSGRPGVDYPTMDIDSIVSVLESLAFRVKSHGLLIVIGPDSFRTPLDRDFGKLRRRRPGVWWKCNGGMGYGLKRDFEDIHYWTGDEWKPRTSIPGVIPSPRGHDRYATSKPITLWTHLLEAFCHEGWTVYDPFAGGGSVGDAARILDMVSVMGQDEIKPSGELIGW